MNPIPHKRRDNALLPGSTVPTPFDNWTVDHAVYRAVRQWLMERLESFSEPAIFIIVGPAGAGKTTLIRNTQVDLEKRMQQQMADDPSLIPYVSGEATYTPGVGMDWRSLFDDMLASGNEFLIGAKVADPMEQPGRNLRGLLGAVNSMLLHRSPAVAMVDEGSAMLESGSKGVLQKNLNYLKSFGNRSKTHLAFFGDYRLAELTSLNGQLNRRCYAAHLPPYPPAMIGEFHKVVIGFEKRARSFGIDCELNSSYAMLFEGSCGCVGLLRRWINEAYIEARRHKRPLNNAVLCDTMPPDEILGKWRAEIADGASQMAKINKRTTRVFEP